MSWDLIAGAVLPVALGVLLVAVALIGSHVSPAARRRAERFVSYPLLMGLLGGEMAWSLWTHDTLRTAVFGVPFVLYGALRKPLSDKQPPAAPERLKLEPFERHEPTGLTELKGRDGRLRPGAGASAS